MRTILFIWLCIIIVISCTPAHSAEMAVAPVFKPTGRDGVAKLSGKLTYEASKEALVLYCINHKKAELDCVVWTAEGLLVIVPIVGSEQEARN